MKRSLRFWIGGLVSLAFVGFAIAVLVHEIRFGLEAVSTTATVEKYTRRTFLGRGGGAAVHEVDGRAVKATFHGWYFYRGPGEGERVPVLFLPSDPGSIAMDSFIQRYGPLVFPLVLALAAAHWAGVFRQGREAPIPRQQSEVKKATPNYDVVLDGGGMTVVRDVPFFAAGSESERSLLALEDLGVDGFWTEAVECFNTDDGSLPGIEVAKLSPAGVSAVYGMLRRRSRLSGDHAPEFWSRTQEASVLVDSVPDAAGLVAASEAEAFHLCIEGVVSQE